MEAERSPNAPTAPLTAEEEALKARRIAANKQYGRGPGNKTKHVRDHKRRAKLKRTEEKFRDAALAAKDAEILLEHSEGFLEPEGVLERTYKVRQDEIKTNVGVDIAKKGFELRLNELGPYVAEYGRNGRDLLLAGRKGHVATLDWREGKSGCEIQLNETVRDAKWLHNHTRFALAQKRHVYIYDNNGVEVHHLSKLVDITNMEFLPYHHLLATIGNPGWLRYNDLSTGDLVAEMSTKMGAPSSFAQNPYNAIMHVGHANGQVSLWSPNATTPLVKLLAHRGPVRSLAVDREGRYMVSTGQDLKMSIWDIRMFKEVNRYFTRQPATTVSISDRSLTAVGWGTQVSIWRGLFDKSIDDIEMQPKVQSPYMAWGGEGQRIERVRWCPFEDVLGVSHDQGFSSVLVPGAGEPNFDALEVNPYENKRQRQEGEVRSLLNKLQPGTIGLNPNFIGNLDQRSHEQRKAEQDLDKKPEDPVAKAKNRGRGRNGAVRKLLRKRGQKNVVDEQRLKLEAALKQQTNRDGEKLRRQREAFGPALARFARKGG